MIYVHSLGRASRFYSDQTALAPGDKRLTFRELHGRLQGIAAMLSKEGLGAGDRLALLLPNGPEYIELVYACSLLGVIVVPLNTRLSGPEIDRVLEDASPRGLVRYSSMPMPSVRLPWHHVLDEKPLAVPDVPNDSYRGAFYNPEAVLALIYTSGTTGRPKGVMVTHANVLANVHHFNYWMRYEKSGVFLHAAPMFHIADFPAMFAAPAFGLRQVTIPKFSPESFFEMVEREGVSHTVLVPTMINLLVQHLETKPRDLRTLEVVAYGGSPMAPELIRRMRKLLPDVKLVQVYGLSETGFLTGLQDQEHTQEGLRSCGRPCPGIDLQIVDESGQQLQTGHHGELVARGANVMRGYWNNTEETAYAFRNGLFRTGDVGYQDENGFFFILDRLKDMIVTGGENVYSGEVEAAIYQHPAVREAAVFGIPDVKWGEVVMACVVLKPGMLLTADELGAHCRRVLASYKIPRRIEFYDGELPKSASGKVLKRTLREQFWVNEERAIR